MFQKLSDLINAAKKGADLLSHFDEVLAKLKAARGTLDEIRKLIDAADTAIDSATANGKVLPDSMKPMVPLLDALRRVVDMLDDAADEIPEANGGDAATPAA